MRIVAKNLPLFMTEEEIRREFSMHGAVTDVCMLKNSIGEFRRMCFVGYLDAESAQKAVKYRDGSFLKNQRIKCEIAEEAEWKERANESEERRIVYTGKIMIRDVPLCVTDEYVREELGKLGELREIEVIQHNRGKNVIVSFKSGESAVKAYKSIRLLAGKRVRIKAVMPKAGNKERVEHYNSLFFSFESVVRQTCENERVSAEELVDVKSKDLGPRISLVETHLVKQTEKFLRSNGIFLDRMTGQVDKKVLIVRNMSLMKCLDLVKEDCKISIAPSKCLALLKFAEEKDAVACYRSLCLRRMKGDVIYCEFAPVCDASEQAEDEKPAGPVKMCNKVLVKNVPFQASREDIKSIFDARVHVVDVRIPKKREGSSRGFCFVTLSSPEDVSEAIEYFGNSTHLYGRRLVLERAKS
jgi:multiple RNA-binding domain-containing protein 1